MQLLSADQRTEKVCARFGCAHEPHLEPFRQSIVKTPKNPVLLCLESPPNCILLKQLGWRQRWTIFNIATRLGGVAPLHNLHFVFLRDFVPWW